MGADPVGMSGIICSFHQWFVTDTISTIRKYALASKSSTQKPGWLEEK